MGERRGERDADVNPPRPRDAKKAEAHLSDPITSSIASASPDSIMLLDREGRIRFINHPAPTLTNEQVLGTSVYDYVSADQHAAMRACFEYVLATGQPSRYDNVFRPPDEAASFWESRVGAVKEGGAITGLVVIASNVTERRGAAADRDLFFKLSLDLYCVADPRGFFRRVNPAFERTLGWSEAELLSQPFLEFVHEEDRERTVAAVQQLGQGQNVLDFVNRYRRKDGTYIVLSWRGTSDPETQMIYATARDVTERLALEERLRRSQKMDALGQLAGGIAHDFNNLLLVMMGNLELALVPDGTAASVVNPIREAQRACERAADLTRHLLTFSRRQPPHLAGVDVNEIVTTTLKLLERVLPASIAIEFVPEAGLPRVSADRSQMEQVLMNLCLNARDAMPRGGRLALRTQTILLDDDRGGDDAAPSRYVRLSVSDTGSGMPAELRERIFEPFFTTKEAGRGTGLGLSTVYGIVQNHAGLVHVHSEPGAGSTFEVDLPADQDVAAQAPGLPDAPTLRGSETILLAEDQDDVRRVVAAHLRAAGYTVIETADGRAAVNAFRAQPDRIGLVLLDVVMPVMDGPEACQAIREIAPGAPVLFTSGYTEAHGVRGILPPDAPHLQKPYEARELLRTVRLAIETRRT